MDLARIKPAFRAVGRYILLAGLLILAAPLVWQGQEVPLWLVGLLGTAAGHYLRSNGGGA